MATDTQYENGAATANRSPLEATISATEQAILDRPELLAMRMENETIMAECRVRPRNLPRIRAELTELLDAFPELADDAIYEKPVGKERGSSQMKFARGLSIRAAEAIAECYGYCRVRSSVTPLDAKRVTVEASFTDFQRGRIWQDSGIVSREYKTAQGGTGLIPEDRFYGVIVKAEASRRVREVVLRSVNPALKAWFEAECEKRLAAILTDDVVAKTVKAFAGIGVTAEQLEGFVGRPMSMAWTSADRIRLQGLWNAIKDGETTVAQAFAIEPAADKAKVRKSDLTETLAKPKATEPEAAIVQTTAPPAYDLRVDELQTYVGEANDLETLARIEKFYEDVPGISPDQLAYVRKEIKRRAEALRAK